MLALTDQPRSDRSWQATLELQLERTTAGTRLSRSRHIGPLYVQKPFYPEGREHPHIYLLHPPGGIVSGDCLSISIDAKTDAGVLVTTPGAARIYRARQEQPLQRQQVQLTLGAGAILEWFPLETIVFNGACVELETTIDITEGSRFIGWEISCFGLPACAEPFHHGSYQQHYQLRKDGLPLFVERLVIDPQRDSLLMAKAGLQGNPVTGFFLLGPIIDDAEPVLESLREQVLQLEMQSLAAISKVGDFYVGRYMGKSAEQARKIFIAWWKILRPRLLDREACAPRIWST